MRVSHYHSLINVCIFYTHKYSKGKPAKLIFEIVYCPFNNNKFVWLLIDRMYVCINKAHGLSNH